MHEKNDHNDLQSIITHALEKMEQDLGIKYDPDHVTLAELSYGSIFQEEKLRCLQKHGFVVVPHGLTESTAIQTVLSGYKGAVLVKAKAEMFQLLRSCDMEFLSC